MELIQAGWVPPAKVGASKSWGTNGKVKEPAAVALQPTSLPLPALLWLFRELCLNPAQRKHLPEK